MQLVYRVKNYYSVMQFCRTFFQQKLVKKLILIIQHGDCGDVRNYCMCF